MNIGPDGRFLKGHRLAVTHGFSVGGHKNRTYRIWKEMRKRCNNKNCHEYKNYGGRGIAVCARWSKFENFLADMGEAPADLSIDRKNNDGHYEPVNCRWATQLEQMSNTRVNRYIAFRGETLHLSEWARRIGIGVSALHSRFKKGWPLEVALAKCDGKRIKGGRGKLAEINHGAT